MTSTHTHTHTPEVCALRWLSVVIVRHVVMMNVENTKYSLRLARPESVGRQLLCKDWNDLKAIQFIEQQRHFSVSDVNSSARVQCEMLRRTAEEVFVGPVFRLPLSR